MIQSINLISTYLYTSILHVFFREKPLNLILRFAMISSITSISRIILIHYILKQTCCRQQLSILVEDLYQSRTGKRGFMQLYYPFPRRQILYSSKLTDFADDNFEQDKNG